MKTLWTIPLTLLLLTACSGQEYKEQRVKEVRKILKRHLELLPEAYSQEDARVLRETSTPKEIETVSRNIRNLHAHAYHMEVELKEIQILYIDIFNESNAFVKTTEVWDVTTTNPHTGELRGHEQGALLHVMYYVKDFHKDGWRVTERIVDETKKRIQWTGPD